MSPHFHLRLSYRNPIPELWNLLSTVIDQRIDLYYSMYYQNDNKHKFQLHNTIIIDDHRRKNQ